MDRPSWDVYFANIVENVARRSTCIRHQFGAVIVNENREILSTGYNGPVRGAPHCVDKNCDTCDLSGHCNRVSECRGNWKHWKPRSGEQPCVKDEEGIASGMGHGICPAVHAEQNALIQAGKHSVGATLYVNGFPCKICARLMVNAGIKKVIVSGEYTDRDGLAILNAAGVEIGYTTSENKPDEKQGKIRGLPKETETVTE